MGTVIVRYKTKRERADENQALIEKVFGELDRNRPSGLRYSAFRLADAVSFVHVASIETDDGANPLGAMPAFSEFLREIEDRCEEAPLASGATVVGSYRSFPTDPTDRTDRTDPEGVSDLTPGELRNPGRENDDPEHQEGMA
jgi:hypothetical protein